jgi:hypothetical protein
LPHGSRIYIQVFRGLKECGEKNAWTEATLNSAASPVSGHSDYKAMMPYIDIVDSIKASSMTKFDGPI